MIDRPMAHPPQIENEMTDKKTLLLAQGLITMMMASFMSGIMSFIALGPTAQWWREWPIALITAWPIAFCLTLFVGPLGFKLAGIIMGCLNRAEGRPASGDPHAN
jgi:hypothetical protein